MRIMIREKRIEAITNELKRDKIVSIEDLMSKLNVSRSTVYRDLCDLEEKNEAKCIRGGAVAVKQKTSYAPPFNIRKDLFFDEKQRIAAAAAELIQEKETILLDSGTTVFELTKLLMDARNLYIATNDLQTATALAGNENVEVTVLGGLLRKQHNSLHGFFTESMLSQIHTDKVFLGVDAVDLNIGFMNFSGVEVQTKRLMISAANEVIVLCDHSKFETRAFVTICRLYDVDMVITGRELDKKYYEEMKEMGVNITLV